MAKKGSSAGQKARHTAYSSQDRAAKNKLRKLAKHLKKHVNDLQAQNALSSGVGRTRKTPNNKNGWVKDSIKAYYGSFQSVFSKHNSSYQDLPVIGKHNLKVVAQYAKLSRKVSKLPNVFTKSGIHKLYAN